jgi:dienelactone hydrolase
VTGPVARFARQIAGQGYICVAPSSYHEFTGPEALKYDAEDTDKGNLWKISKVRAPRLLTTLNNTMSNADVLIESRSLRRGCLVVCRLPLVAANM